MNRLCKQARSLGVYVLLGGDCLDEYSAGYRCYERMFRDFAGNFLELGNQVGLAMAGFHDPDRTRAFLDHQRSFRKRILQVLAPVTDAKERFALSVLLHDTAVFLSSCNLPHSDAYSMKTSVELRNPMLDIDLVRYVVNLPLKYKVRSSQGETNNKAILRALARRRLGDWIQLPKEGTRNYSKWISDQACWNLDNFLLKREFPLPNEMGWKLLYRLICLELFHRSYFVNEYDPLTNMLSRKGRETLIGDHYG
jgi:asparagine synthase (glutamine-hydrolysing)